MKSGEHGPDEIYDKFTVVKSKHVVEDEIRHPPTGQRVRIKRFDLEHELTHKDEWIFVLRPETNDKAAIAALRTYARVCAATYPELSEQIEKKINETVTKYPEGNPALRPVPYMADGVSA